MTTEGTDSGDPGAVNLWRVDEVERRQPTPTVDQDHLSIVDRRHVGAWPTHLRVPGNESWTMEPNSTSTGVGVLTSVLNLSPPPAGCGSRLQTDHFEFAAIRLDLEHCHAVMSAVRIVEEVPQSARSKSMAIRLMCGPLG
jgi:hypothetical protein